MQTDKKHGLGHIRDRHDPRDRKLRALIGKDAPLLPLMVDLTSHIDRVRDQLKTSSCVGQAVARAVHMRASIEGRPVAYPSALHVYAAARAIDVADPKHTLDDEGCTPRSAARALANYGVVSEERWPFDPSRVRERPPWDVLRQGVDAKITGYYAVDGGVDGIKRALASGYPVPFGMVVDDRYFDYAGGLYEPGGTDAGGHMQCLCGYDPEAFVVVNSWGEQWGQRGLSRIPHAFMTSDRVFDFWALSASVGSVQ
jgi:C1A family cysteine protease